MLGIIISAGIMSMVSAYILFKLNESNDENGINNALKIMFFFMVLATFVIMGSAGYEARNDCDYLLMNSTVTGNLTENAYGYVCEERVTGSASWVYRLPVWLSYASAGYMVLYLLILIKTLVMQLLGKGGERG